MEKTVKKGDKVKVDYIGKLKDGKVFDTSIKSEAEKANILNANREYKALEFEVGSGQMIKGFDKAVEGMKENETKEVTIHPEEAYGERREELIKEVPKKMFGENANLSEGMRIAIQTPHGPLIAKIAKVSDDTVTLDLNHELAGQELHFTITVKEIKKSNE